MTGPGADQPRGLEIELKYRMTDVATGERLIAADDLAGFVAQGPAVTVRNEDRYLDTPDGALAAAGYAGRLRSSGTGTVITLKGLRGEDDGGAVHRREELEGPADPATGAAGWPDSAARDAVLAIAGETALVDLVTIRQSRHKRLYGRDGAVVEVSVDDVEVVAGERTVERFAELELELREGDERALDPLADLLSEVEELLPAETSKLERALEALRGEPVSGEDDHEAGDGEAAEGGRRRARARDPGAGGAGGSADHPAEIARRHSRTTTSPRPGARCCGSISPAWSRARRGRGSAGMPRSCTRCASRPVASGPPGACSAMRSTRPARRSSGSASRRSRRTWVRCGTWTSSSRPPKPTGTASPPPRPRRSSRSSPRGGPAATPRGSSWSRSWTRSVTAVGWTGTSRSSRPRASGRFPSDPCSRTACVTRCRPGSGRPTRSCAPTSR